MMPPVLSVPPSDAYAGVGCRRRRSTAAWMGEKRRKDVGGPSPPLGLLSPSYYDATGAMIRPQVQEEQGQEEFVDTGDVEDLVFSAEDDIGYEELSRYCQELRSRRHLLYVDESRKIRGKAKDDLYERLCGLRLREYKILKDAGRILDDGTNVYPTEISDFEDASEPGPSMFGWTIDHQYFHLSELNDYQRIVPMRENIAEYKFWEEYRTIFSKYETDVDYVKYCDEISKKIKWVEEYLTQEHEHVSSTYKHRVSRQARKIAAGFSHLPLTLATRGYEEYLLDLYYDLELKDYILAYFEVWKRIVKQKMSFEDAVKQTRSENKFHYPCRIEAQINGYDLIHLSFESCMNRIPIHVVEDDDVLELIKDVVCRKSERPKKYVDYVKKKIEVAQRIGVTQGMGGGEEGTFGTLETLD